MSESQRMRAVEKVWREIECGQPCVELLKSLKFALRTYDEESQRKSRLSFNSSGSRQLDWCQNLNQWLIAILIDRTNALNPLAIDCFELLNRNSFQMRSDAIRACSNWLLGDELFANESQTERDRSLADYRYDFRLFGLFYRLMCSDAAAAADDRDCDGLPKKSKSQSNIYGRIFGVCKLALFYPDFRASELFPAPMMLDDSTSKSRTSVPAATGAVTTTATSGAASSDSKQLKKVFRKKPNKHDHSSEMTTLSSSTDNCDSESDFQSENESCIIDVLTKKIHQIGLKLLLLIIEQSPKRTICNYWFHFVSDTNSSLQSFYKRNQTHRKLQLSLLQVLKLMMVESRPLLEHAEFKQSRVGTGAASSFCDSHADGNLTFISLGESIGQSVVQLHEFLLDVVRPMSASATIVRLQALKCFECLVLVTPYAKMFAKHTRMLKDFAFVMKTLIAKQTDVHVKTSAFCIVRHLIKCNLTVFNNVLLVGSDDNSPIWILIETFRNLLYNWNGSEFQWNSAPQIVTVPPCLQIESLQMFRTLFELKNASLEAIMWAEHRSGLMKALRTSLSNPNETVRLYTLKTIQAIGKCLSDDHYSTEFWAELLDVEYFFAYSANESSLSVREAFCECFAGLRYEAIAALEPSTTKAVFDYLKKAAIENCRESHQLTAIDTLVAITIANAKKLFKNRYCYQTIFHVILVTLRSNTDSLRFSDKIKDRIAELLGFVTDTFEQIDTPEPIIDFVHEILPITCQYSPLKQWRIVTKLVHVIRNLFVALKRHRIIAPFRYIFETNSSTTIQFLLNCLDSGRGDCAQTQLHPNVKVKWNVCYSLASILQACNEHVLAIDTGLFIEIVDRLTIELSKSSNFKVRTNASLALKMITDRGLIGDRYVRIWNVLVEALAKADEITDFKEYEHQKSLKVQICATIVHWVTMASTETDRNELRASVAGSFDDVFERNSQEFQGQMEEIGSRLFDLQRQLLLDLVHNNGCLNRICNCSNSTSNNTSPTANRV